MSEEWDSVLKSRKGRIAEIRKSIPQYDYSQEHLAHKTDELLCTFLVNSLHRSKEALFRMAQSRFEAQNLASKEFQDIRQDVDTFSDQVKCRMFDWDKCSTSKWLERVVDRDHSLVSSLTAFSMELEGPARTQELKKLLASLKSSFKERDSVCNLKRN